MPETYNEETDEEIGEDETIEVDEEEIADLESQIREYEAYLSDDEETETEDEEEDD